MSIFKATFKDYIKKQINTRQNLLNSKGSRPLDLQKYVSAKSPWVKMTSFVDYGDPKKGEAPTKDLAKRYVLMGGTLYADPNDKTDTKFALRSGILNKNSAYGTDLGSSKAGSINMQYGIRPMPGITSVSVKSKSAYGSLREAVVKFYAWDVKQLEDLLILYMRPGYPLLLEWGWSMYLDSNKDGRIRDFDTPTINCFKENLTQDDVYAELEKLKKQSAGNYDGMLGLIRNYETSMLPNGGFECTVTLISVGDVIDSLRMNSESGDITLVNPDTSDPKQNTSTGSPDKKDLKDEFELLLTEYTLSNISTFAVHNKEIFDIIKVLKNSASLIPGIDTNIYRGISNDDGKNSDKGQNLIDNDNRKKHYMQFAYFIHILNSKRNLYFKGGKLIDLEIPLPTITSNTGNGLCIGSYNSMTIDNARAIIKNTSAKIVSADGFLPNVGYVDDYQDVPNEKVAMTQSVNSAIGTVKEFLYDGTNLGAIGNIYVNIGMLIEVYKKELASNKGFVYLGKYIKSVLGEMQFALGSVNDFDLYVNDNKAVIIDKHYVEPPADTKYSEKFQINILGTDSIVRNQKIVSKIFPSQATMIAIAAQSRSNVASLQSSTYTSMNAGLKNRLLLDLSDIENDINDEKIKAENIFYNNLVALIYHVETNIINFVPPVAYELSVGAANTFLNNFIVRVDRGTDYKAIIPVSLEIAMDGIGGITIGEIFTINKDIIPREYSGKGVGFIVTGISQDITRPDWQTTLHTQFCLLDQVKRQQEAKKLADSVLNGFKDYKNRRIVEFRQSFALYNIFAGFISDLYLNNFELKPANFSSYKIQYKSGISGNLKAQINENSKFVDITYNSFITEVERLLNLNIKGLYDNIHHINDTFAPIDDNLDPDIISYKRGIIDGVIEAFNSKGPNKTSKLDDLNYDLLFGSYNPSTIPILEGFKSSLVKGTESSPNMFYNKMLPDVKTAFEDMKLRVDKNIIKPGTFSILVSFVSSIPTAFSNPTSFATDLIASKASAYFQLIAVEPSSGNNAVIKIVYVTDKIEIKPI